METRAERVATELSRAIEEVADFVRSCPDEKWRAACDAEGWTVAQTAHHMSSGFPIEMEYVTAGAEGRPLPSYSWDDIDRITREQAESAVSITKAEVLEQLTAGAASTLAYIRALTDQQLDRTSSLALQDGATVTAQDIIEHVVLTDHFRGHLASMRAAAHG
jgi:uncharacterized damage-inducible protein DinB